MGINFHLRYCKNCGATLNEHSQTCPNCNSHNIQGISRVTGYLSLDERFGSGKAAERSDRITHNGSHSHGYHHLPPLNTQDASVIPHSGGYTL